MQLAGSGMTSSDQIARHARKIPDKTALRFGERGLTYRELDEHLSRLANALIARGVERGDRVAVLGLNGIEVLESYLACSRIGAICVPINFRLVAEEVAYALTDSGAAAAVVDTALAPVLAEARAKAPELRTCLLIGDDPAAAGPGTERFEDALAAADPAPPEIVVDERDPAYIMYTSGTTGRPKGAVLSHHNLLMHGFSMQAHLGMPPGERVGMNGAPLFHIAGVSSVLPNLLLGGCTVLTRSGRFDPAEIVDLLERERVTDCFFVPAQWQAICAVPGVEQRDFSALHRVSWGAAPASTPLLRRMIEVFSGAEVVTAFGQTECSPVTCLLRGEDALRKIGSVGTPMLNVEVRVVDEDMNDVPPGEVGEAVYRGPTVMSGYWGKPEATAEAFTGGWFHSGDLVRADDEGYLYVVDRKKDMIISGGENIYCAEVEDVLAAHPKIADAALIGVPDERWGETPLAVLVASDVDDPPTPAEVTAHCREHLAGYKRPRHIAVVPELPRNPSGKVLKTTLRQQRAAGELPDTE